MKTLIFIRSVQVVVVCAVALWAATSIYVAIGFILGLLGRWLWP